MSYEYVIRYICDECGFKSFTVGDFVEMFPGEHLCDSCWNKETIDKGTLSKDEGGK